MVVPTAVDLTMATWAAAAISPTTSSVAELFGEREPANVRAAEEGFPSRSLNVSIELKVPRNLAAKGIQDIFPNTHRGPRVLLTCPNSVVDALGGSRGLSRVGEASPSLPNSTLGPLASPLGCQSAAPLACPHLLTYFLLLAAILAPNCLHSTQR